MSITAYPLIMKKEEINKTTKVHNVSEYSLLKHSKIVWVFKEFINKKPLKNIPFLDIPYKV